MSVPTVLTLLISAASITISVRTILTLRRMHKDRHADETPVLRHPLR